MPEEKTFIEKTQTKNILEIISEDVLKRLLYSYRYPLQTGLTVYYPKSMPASMENLLWLELKEKPVLNFPFCDAYWHKPIDPEVADEYCEQTCKKYDKQIVLKYYDDKWDGPRLFHCHCWLWDMTYPLFAGGRLVGVLYGGQIIVTEEVEDWCIGLKDVINEVVWKPDIKVDWDLSYENEVNEMTKKSNQVAIILAKVNARTDIISDKKKQIENVVKELQEKRKTSVGELVERYKKFRGFGNTLEKVLEDLYAAKAEAARHEHIHSSSRDISAGGDRRGEEPEEFWNVLDKTIFSTLPDLKGYIIYKLDEYKQAYETERTYIFDKDKVFRDEDFERFCRYIFDKLHEKRKKKRNHIIYHRIDEKKVPEIFRDSFRRAIDNWSKEAEGVNIVSIPLAESGGKIAGGLVCVCTSSKQIGGIGMRSAKKALKFYVGALIGIVDALSMILARYDSKERRAKELGQLTHELKVPLVAIRGAVDCMKRTTGIKDVLDYDYIGDILSWSDLMGRLINKANVLRYSGKTLDIRPTRTFILRDVIASAIRETKLLLKERGFSSMNISYNKERFQKFPLLWIDRNMFQQVVFNLLTNSIKYAYKDPTAFQVEIEGDETNLTIVFRDWGPGIAEEIKELIFEEGFRGPNAEEADVTGQGLGLWMVRQIIDAHGGKVKVTNLKLPTEFTIWLPYSLTLKPPILDKGE